jgi:uncharacterized protein YndB with AHSA1/START domain
MSDVVLTRLIAASPATVFSFFTDPARWTSWQGVDGQLDPRPGGIFRIRMPGSEVASGEFVEIVPNQRVVFTWGWEGEGSAVPPGSTTVVIELEPHGTGTRLHLTHNSLAPPPVAEHHRLGWNKYLDRLVVRAEGGDPGPDTPEP